MVADIGCGWGFTTLALMEELPGSDCVGIDKFNPNDPPCSAGYGLFSIAYVRHLYQQLGSGRSPVLKEGDILRDGDLPFGFDLIYCKRVLYNMWLHDNASNNLGKAIDHVANALKPNGWFCLVEIQQGNFTSTLQDSIEGPV